VRRRILTIALAVLLALAGTGAVLVYVQQADTRALAGQAAVQVLVAQRQIPSGTPASSALSEGLLATQTLPAQSVPAAAVRSLGGQGSLVTSSDIQPGQLLLRQMLVPAAQLNGALAVPSGMVAVTVDLCVPESVAGNLHPGSQVAVYGTTGSSGLSASAGCSGQHQQQAGAHTRLVLPKVEVLSIGEAAAGQASTQSGATVAQSSSQAAPNATLVTVAVSQVNAARLIQLAVSGLPYLALVK